MTSPIENGNNIHPKWFHLKYLFQGLRCYLYVFFSLFDRISEFFIVTLIPQSMKVLCFSPSTSSKTSNRERDVFSGQSRNGEVHWWLIMLISLPSQTVWPNQALVMVGSRYCPYCKVHFMALGTQQDIFILSSEFLQYLVEIHYFSLLPCPKFIA